MATLVKTSISLAGVNPNLVAAAGGGDDVNMLDDTYGGARTFLHVKNTGGSICTVTLDDVSTPTPASATAFNPDVAVAVPATTGEKFIGPLMSGRFMNPTTGKISWSYSGVTGVMVEVVQLP